MNRLNNSKNTLLFQAIKSSAEVLGDSRLRGNDGLNCWNDGSGYGNDRLDCRNNIDITGITVAYL